MAGLGAGGRFFGDLNRRVAGRADGLCFCLIAARAGKRLDTGVFTSRSGRDHTIVPSVAKRGNDLAVCDLFVTILAVGVASIAGRGAGGILRAAKLRILMRARLSAPDAVDIVNGIAGLGRLRLGVGAVGVVELGGSDGDLVCRHVGTALRVLIRRGLRAGSALLAVDAGTLAGADIRTAGGGVDAADGGQRTVDVHLRINKVFYTAIIIFPRGISYRTEIAFAGVCIGNPFVTVIDVDALAVGNHQLGTLGDGGLHAGQQCRRLVDSQLAAGDQIDGHVVGQRQNIAAGADACSRQLQVQAVELCLTVDGVDDAVGGAVIRLGQTAGDDFEHAFVPDKGNGGGVDLPHGVYRSIHRLAGALVQGQGYLHILHGVLAKGEHLVAHVGSCGAAAEVQHLIPLVNRAAGLHCDSTAAGNEAPCVQCAAGLHVDGAAGFHFDIAIGPNDVALSTAGGGIILAADTDGAIHGKRSTLTHSQRPEYLSALLGGGGSRGSSIAGLGLVKGNQQGDLAGDGIVPRDLTALGERDGRGQLLLRLRDRVVQVVKDLAAGLKERQLLADEPRRDGTVTVKVQSGLGIGADALSAGHIVPPLEAVALRRGRLHLIGGHGALGVGVHLGDIPPVHGIAAIFGGLEGHSGTHVGHQLHVGHGDLGVGAGTAGFNLHRNGAAGFKLHAEAAVCGGRGVVHQNRTFAYHDGIVKGQRRLCGLLVGDGQRRTVVASAATASPRRGPNLTDDLRAAGAPRVVRSAGEAQADALVSQPDNGAAVRRIRRHGHVGKQHEHHAHAQHKGKEAPIHIFHFLPTFFPFFTL